MPKYIVERDMEGAGNMTSVQLHDMSQKSCNVIEELGPTVQWIESYVTDNKFYCVYIAPDEGMIRKHAELGGFPVTSVKKVETIIDPTTAE